MEREVSACSSRPCNSSEPNCLLVAVYVPLWLCPHSPRRCCDLRFGGSFAPTNMLRMRHTQNGPEASRPRPASLADRELADRAAKSCRWHCGNCDQARVYKVTPHLRRIIIEAAWAYRHRPGLGARLLARQRDQREDVKAIAWKAQHRLHARYAKLLAKGKAKQQVVTAVGRELLGFVWAIGVAVERAHANSPKRSLKRAA